MATLDELQITAKQHSDRIRTMETAVKSFEKVAEQVFKNQRYLFGNGEAGLDERVRVQENVSIRQEAEIKELKNIANSIQPMVIFFKVGIWFAGIIGVSIIALIWSLITGQAELFFK